MNKLIGCVITGILLWVGAQLFPTYIMVEDVTTLLIVVLIMAVVDYLVVGGVSIILLTTVFSGSVSVVVFGIIWSIVVLLALFPIELYVLSSNLEGFRIVGFWTYAILTVAHSILTNAFSVKQKD